MKNKTDHIITVLKYMYNRKNHRCSGNIATSNIYPWQSTPGLATGTSHMK